MNKETPSSDEVKIVAPDYSLKKIVGENVDVKALFNSENIAQAQVAIESQKDNFLDWVKADLNTLEECYQNASKDIANSAEDIKKLAHTAFVIKSQAGTFGFALGTVVAKSLDDFCNHGFMPTREHLTVIRKHMDTLQAIFTKNITGDGGAMGSELVGNLHKLVDKYKKA